MRNTRFETRGGIRNSLALAIFLNFQESNITVIPDRYDIKDSTKSDERSLQE